MPVCVVYMHILRREAEEREKKSFLPARIRNVFFYTLYGAQYFYTR